MALFINTGKHPDVFKNSHVTGNNQSYYRNEYFSELLKEQKHVNHTVMQTLKELKLLNQEQDIRQEKRWHDLIEYLDKRKGQNIEQKQFQTNILNFLHELNTKSEQLQTDLQAEEQTKQEIFQQILRISDANSHMENALYNQKNENDQLTNQLEEIMNQQAQLNIDTEKRDKQYNQMIQRMQNQEALVEKALRQLSHMRGILFERSSHIVDKMEATYYLTTSYVGKMLKGSQQPLAFFTEEEQKKKK